MIHGTENQSLRFAKRKAANHSLDGRKLPLLPIRIFENPRSIERNAVANFPGLRTQNDSREANAFVACCGNKMLGKSFSAIAKQRFGLAHAPRFTGGQNGDGKHAGSVLL